jgi:hypothetical protein
MLPGDPDRAVQLDHLGRGPHRRLAAVDLGRRGPQTEPGPLFRGRHVVGAPGDGWKVAMVTLALERGAAMLGLQVGFRRDPENLIAAASLWSNQN